MEDINYQNLVFEYIEFIVKNTNLPSPDNFIGEFVQAFNEQVITILCKLLQKIEEEGLLCNSFYEASITNPR